MRHLLGDGHVLRDFVLVVGPFALDHGTEPSEMLTHDEQGVLAVLDRVFHLGEGRLRLRGAGDAGHQDHTQQRLQQ